MIEKDLLERVLGRALAGGGEWAEVFALDSGGSSARLEDGRIEELTSGRERGAGIRVIVGESTGFAHTADLTEAGLLEAAAAASAAAKGAAAGTVRTIALERRVNPFLRCGESTVRRAAEAHDGRPLETAVEVFAAVRRWKDGFQA